MKGDMIETYKIISGLEDVNSFQFFTRLSMKNLRGFNLKLYKEHFHKVIRKSFFSEGDLSMNGLPNEAVTAKTLNSFKNSLDNFLRRYRH